MDKARTLARIKEVGLVPIIRTPSAEDALAVAEQLVEADLGVLEVTLTVPGALDVVSELARRFGERVIVGAGSVLDARQAEACLQAGARFIISPALDLSTIAFCKTARVPILPGALTPTEILNAWNAGADMVKVFPCGAVGGAAYLRAVKAPLPQIEMVPTGGVSLDTAADFIQAGAAALGVGGDLCDLEALRAGNGAAIGARARRYLEVVRRARAGASG
jgi:2-dehydro-3-deoxyphosphogluconate aldolase / (4S)-4-hydroxy-2-oxoglutarate aldolase